MSVSLDLGFRKRHFGTILAKHCRSDLLGPYARYEPVLLCRDLVPPFPRNLRPASAYRRNGVGHPRPGLNLQDRQKLGIRIRFGIDLDYYDDDPSSRDRGVSGGRTVGAFRLCSERVPYPNCKTCTVHGLR